MSSSQIVNFVSAISNAAKSPNYSFFWPRSKTIFEVLKILKKRVTLHISRFVKIKKKIFLKSF